MQRSLAGSKKLNRNHYTTKSTWTNQGSQMFAKLHYLEK